MPAPKGNQYAVGHHQGRPTDYRPEYAKRVRDYCLLGATDEQIAGFLETTVTSLQRWRAANEDFRLAFTKGRIDADAKMAKSLWHRGRGYDHTITRTVMNDKGESVQLQETKHYPSDTNAASFWLRNRQRGLWQDNKTLELTGADGGPINVHTESEFTADLSRQGVILEGVYEDVSGGSGQEIRDDSRDASSVGGSEPKFLGNTRPDLLRPRETT